MPRRLLLDLLERVNKVDGCSPGRPIVAHRFLLPLVLILMASPAFAAGIDFNRQIRPLLAEHCFQCHGPDAEHRAADLRLDRESDAKVSAIRSNDVESSPLLTRILSTDVESQMPPPSTGKVLTSEQKTLIHQWLKEGAPYSAHWAFEPIANGRSLMTALPEDKRSDRELPIDRFLLDKLREQGLDYSPEVSKFQFLRRATFDLTGLPPTLEEIDAFVKDDRNDAVEQCIDRLLSSPRYAERWGRHWLDIARYADTHGGAAIGFTTFPFAYTYRDYVIRSMGEDKAMNRFILEQLAADQLDLKANDPSLAALGFLTVGMQFRNYHDTIDDQIDVVTRGLMGITVTCARCHDHKFDSISTADYYSLYATISPSKSPSLLPAIGESPNKDSQDSYQKQLRQLQMEVQNFVRDQSEVLRSRLRMQVGLYLGEIAKGVSEQDLSTQFLSYRTDDIRPLVFNRWRAYLSEFDNQDPVWGPWTEMKNWGPIPTEEFAVRRDVYLGKLTDELNNIGRTPEKLHSLRAESPRWNPLVVDALVEKKPSNLREVSTIYGDVFAELQSQWNKALGAAANEASSADAIRSDEHPEHLVINSPSHRQLRQHLYSPGSPLDIPDEEAMRLTNRTISDLINAKRGAIHQLHLSAAGSPPRAMTLNEDPTPKETYVFLRGNPLTRGAAVQPRFLEVLSKKQAVPFENGKRRLGLAKSIIDESNPLTRRVIVNWAWQHHFGSGLVRTPDDFGTRGVPPTHPELLDYLASGLAENGWSLKWLHREIMRTRAYRQGAIENSESRERDPENLLLWRMPRRRLDFESMRDAMLAVGGGLDTTMGGRPIDLNATPTIRRRSVYGFINRDIIANLMSTFDSANPNACTAKRPETTVPQQTLFALNSEFIQERASEVIERLNQRGLLRMEERIEQLFLVLLGRSPTTAEVAQSKDFLELVYSDGDSIGEKPKEDRRWQQLAHALLASNEFIFLD